MKTVYLILTIFIASCGNTKAVLQNENRYYFYFRDNDSTMNSFYNPEKQTKSYWYELQKADKVLFKVKKEENNLKIKTIRIRDTTGLNIKNYNWLNQFDNTSRYKFFNLKPAKEFYIIEEKPNDHNLYLLEVEFVDEID